MIGSSLTANLLFSVETSISCVFGWKPSLRNVSLCTPGANAYVPSGDAFSGSSPSTTSKLAASGWTANVTGIGGTAPPELISIREPQRAEQDRGAERIEHIRPAQLLVEPVFAVFRRRRLADGRRRFRRVLSRRAAATAAMRRPSRQAPAPDPRWAATPFAGRATASRTLPGASGRSDGAGAPRRCRPRSAPAPAAGRPIL